MNMQIEGNEECAVVDEVVEGQEGEVSEDEGALVVTLGEEVSEEGAEEVDEKTAPQWVKDLRKKTKEQERELREYKRKLAEKETQQVAEEIGKRPSLSDDGIDFDEEVYAQRLLEWTDKKKAAEAAEAAERAKREEADRTFNERLTAYNQKKTALKVEDFDDAESAVVSTLSKTQQGIIVNYCDKPELLIYAVGRNDKELARLAAITDPIKFALEIQTIEREKLKVTTRKPATSPERTVSASAPITSSDKHLEALEREADRTGDRSKIIAYKRTLKKANS